MAYAPDDVSPAIHQVSHVLTLYPFKPADVSGLDVVGVPDDPPVPKASG
jgi:hypothetical protein